MAAQRRHFPQICLHIVLLGKQLIAEQAVDGEDGRAAGEVLADLLDGVPGNGLVIAQLQKYEHVGVVNLPEAGQGVAADLFDGDDTGVVPVNLAEGVLEGPGQDLFVGHVEDVLVDLLGGLAVQRAKYVFSPVRAGGDEAVVAHLVVDVLLIGLYPAVEVADQAVDHRVLIDHAVGGHPALAAGAAHQGDAPLPQGGIHGGQHAGIVPRAEVDTYRVTVGAAHLLDVLLQAADVLHRHGGHLLEHVGRGADAVGESDHAHAVFHDAGLIAHTDAPDAGNPGEELLQGLYMLLELFVV